MSIRQIYFNVSDNIYSSGVLIVIEVIKVGKKRAIYIPKHIAEELGINVGDKLIQEVKDGKIILTHIKKVEKNVFWGEVTIEEVEKVGEEITRDLIGSR